MIIEDPVVSGGIQCGDHRRINIILISAWMGTQNRPRMWIPAILDRHYDFEHDAATSDSNSQSIVLKS